MSDEPKKIKVTFTYGSGMCKDYDLIEVDEDVSDDELDEMLGQWLWEQTDAHWIKQKDDK